MKANYPQAETSTIGCEIETGIRLRLERQKANHERELSKINAAIDALNSQPDVAQLLETVIKAL